MKKKYIGGIAALLVLALVAVGVLLLNGKYTVGVSKDAGYTVTLKDVQLNQAGEASVSKGKQLVFAVTLDKDYSDSDVKVKANDEPLSAQNGVYRYTVNQDTKIAVEGVAKNDHVVSGIDVDPGTMDEQEFTLLKDEEGRPIPVLADLNLNGVDTYDVPDLDLTASVNEAINPGWKYRTLTELNLGKYKGLKFFVKNSNYFQAKLGENADFYVAEGSETWNEFFFKYEEGAMNLYVNGQLKANCNYLSDIQVCLQEVGSYKFSNIYVIERKDYKGAKVTVTEGDGYYLDLPAREYAVNTKLTFHVTIDDDFKKGASFAVKAGGKIIKANEDGSYTFTLKQDTLVSVNGVVAKPLDSRYQVVDMPFFVDAPTTSNYAMMQSVKNGKTYAYTQKTWGYVNLPEINLEKYTSLLFFIRKDDTNENSWISMVQKADDGTETPFLQTNDNRWHRIEFKKEGGKIYFYADKVKYETAVIDAEHFMCALNDNSKVRFTSMVGIVDKNYKEPAPEYLSSKYQAIDMPVLVDAKTVANYELVKKVKGAKTYRYEPKQWCSLGLNYEVNFDKYTDLTFFVKKEDKNAAHWIVLSKVDSKGTSIHDYIANNNNRWYKVDLKKVKNGVFDVYVNGIKQEPTVSKADDLRLVFNEGSQMTFTSLMGIVDKSYKEAKPNYLSKKYKTVASPIAMEAKEVENYVLMNQITGSKTYEVTTLQWQKVGFADVNLDAYKELVFYIHKEDRNSANWIVLQKENKKGEGIGSYIVTNDNKWYKVQLKKVKNGEFEVYVNGGKCDTTVSDSSELKFSFNENSTIQFTSLVGIRDTGYKAPEPNYISSKYEALTYALAVEGTETANYDRIRNIKDAKTYVYTTAQWGEIGFGEITLAKYSQIMFFLHKEDMKTSNWLEFYKKTKGGEHMNYIQNNDNQWYEVVLKKQSSGNKFDVYVNGEKFSDTITDMSELKVTLNGDSTIKYTSLFGIKDPNYQEVQIDYLSAEYQAIAPVVAETAIEIENYNVVSKVEGAKTYSYTSAQWGAHKLLDLDFAPYKSLVFYLKKADLKTANWLEFYATGSEEVYFIQNNDNSWYKIELRKNSKGTFDVYINDTKKDHAVAGASELQIKLNGSSELHFTSLFGIADPDYKEPETEVRGTMVVMAPWAFEQGTMSHSNTAKKLGYTYATAVNGSNASYQGATMMDVNLSEYKSFRFALKSTEKAWWEIGRTKENTFNLIANCASEWVEYEFKNEEGAFVLYENGTQKEITIEETANLSDLQMKFATSGILYMTEVRGEVKDSSVSQWKKVASNFNTYTESFTDSEKPNAMATGSTVTETAWSATKTAMTELSLGDYTKLVFYARKMAGSGWFESNYFGTQLLGDAWTEFKMVRNADATWNLYRGGCLISEKITISNLSEVQAGYGAATYAFSEVFAIEKEKSDEPTVPVFTDTMIVTAPWAFTTGKMDHTKTYTEGKYAYATEITGSNNTYAGALLSDADLSIYKEVRFALKSDGSHWYEIGNVADNDYSFYANAAADWVELKLVDEGNGYFQMYVNGSWVNKNLPLDSNLSDLQMKYGTAGTLLMTEVRGTLREGATEPLKVVAKNFNALEGEEAKEEKPIAAATASTVVTTSWTANEAALADLKLDAYSKLVFYARKTAGSGWFESSFLGIECYDSKWVEHKMVRNADNTWTIYRGGVVAKENVTADNLSALTAKYGEATYVFSEVFAVEKPAAKETMIVATPWAYSQGTLDNTKTWATGGYEYATEVSGSNDTYAGVLMSDVDLSVYKEVRFALKSDGSSWYEIGKVADNNFGMIADSKGSWVEMKLVEEDGVFRLYKKAEGSTENGWTQTTLPLDMNLSDLQMKFGAAGTLLMTEVRGTLRDGAKDTLKVVAKSFNTLTGEVSKTDRPVAAATESTVVTTSWTASESTLSDVNLAKYNKVIFYARKTAGSGWFESSYFGAGLYGSGWIEHKMVRNADNSWTLYRGGVVAKENVTADNLSALTAKYGEATYVFSEVFAVEK